jgi:hypothetical protein
MAGFAALAYAIAIVLSAHDLERTQVTITFARDGSFVVDVANDLEWLKLRLPTFAPAGPKGPALRPNDASARSNAPEVRPNDASARSNAPAVGSSDASAGANGPGVPSSGAVDLAALSTMFIDRVVLFVDGREVRPTSAEYIPPRPPASANAQSDAGNPNAQPALHGASSIDELPLGTYRLRGRMPIDARTLRWYYGLVLDPYPLTIRRADGRTTTETIAGDAWSTPIDISGQFTRTRDYRLWIVVALFALALGLRVVFATRRPGPFGPGARPQ